MAVELKLPLAAKPQVAGPAAGLPGHDSRLLFDELEIVSRKCRRLTVRHFHHKADWGGQQRSPRRRQVSHLGAK